MKKISLIIKRIFDIFLSLIGLIILSPLFIILAILIKIDSDGPVFFIQERLGQYGRVFNILKFRTMVVNAENIGDGISLRSSSDPRITKVGKFLRKYSLDELPQLINVLVGDMSLVGPRPPVTYTPYDGYGNYPDWAKARFIFKPGITGLAQVTVRNSVFWDERIKIDLEYIDSFNIILDFEILLKTLVKAINSDSVYMRQ
ncbi:sugar transferase [Anaerococcus nagyae]|uniref:sugar transferase n=1 Tax=Anaerococcus nagyae TaxID=1755241 RepID=UPI00324EE3DB